MQPNRLLAALLVLLAAPALHADTFTVTNYADSGPGSLRQALADADATTGADTVLFDAGLSGQIIALTSGALNIGDVTVDATALTGGLTINGGGTDRIFLVTGGSTVSLLGLTLTNGSSTSGGAIYNNAGSSLSLELCTLTGNTATSTGGGAIFNDGATLTLSHCTLSSNVTNVIGGGAIAGQSNGTIALDGCTFSGNTLQGTDFVGGGAIRASLTTLTVLRCTFSGNSAPASKGGAVVIVGNTGATPATFAECTFTNNTASLGGGAVHGGSPPLTITNCTLAGNSTTDPTSEGGGIYESGAGGQQTTITHCTVVNNYAGKDGGGIFIQNGTITNCIVANNTAPAFADVKGSVNAVGANIMTTLPSTILSGNSTIYQVDPLLAPLGNYGGPTQTMPPLANSPAIDLAPVSAITNDQRGQPRPVSFRQSDLLLADIGAVEVAPAFADIPPSALTYSANPVVYTRTMLIANNTPGSSGGGGLTYTVAPTLPAGLALDPATGVISGTPTVVAAAANYTVTATNIGGSTNATINITVNDIPVSYTQAQYDANGTANFTAGQNNVINNPNTFSLYTLSQVETLNVGTPLLTKDAGTGQFKLTIGVKKTASLSQPFADFPLTVGGSSIDAQGKLEFLFTVPDNAAFFRLTSQ